MTFVSALIRTARRARHVTKLSAPFEPSGPEGLLPAGLWDGRDVLLDAPDARLAPALVSAALGEYETAAKLLATTRELAEWENRDRYTVRLAAFAVNRPEWLADWLAAAPRDPDALLVKAELAIVEAWGSPARAERLRDVAPLILSAADGDPADPVPWRIALDHARGTHASHTVFEELWGEAIRRSSHHYGCHVAALQYLSAQWYGSHRECFDFAERAAEDSLPGSLIRALPARAAFAYMVGGGGHSIPYERIDAAADLGIELSGTYEAGDPWPAEVRNLLAYVLVVRRRWPETLEEFRRIGPYATSFPWLHLAADPLGQFLELREFVRCEVAAGMPWGRERQKPGRARSDGHYA